MAANAEELTEVALLEPSAYLRTQARYAYGYRESRRPWQGDAGGSARPRWCG